MVLLIELDFVKEYGESHLNYKVFENRDYSTFDTLVLRSGSQHSHSKSSKLSDNSLQKGKENENEKAQTKTKIIKLSEQNEIPNERISTIIEWKANFKQMHLQTWVVVTRSEQIENINSSQNQNQSAGGLYLVREKIIFKKIYPSQIMGIAVSNPDLIFMALSNEIIGISLSTGNMTKECNIKSRFTDICDISANPSSVFILSESSGFSIYHISEVDEIGNIQKKEKYDLQLVYSLIRPMIGQFIRFVPGSQIIAICDRHGSLFLFEENNSNEWRIKTKLSFFAPITGLFIIHTKILITLFTGEMDLVDTTQMELTDKDVSQLFSFQQTCLSES